MNLTNTVKVNNLVILVETVIDDDRSIHFRNYEVGYYFHVVVPPVFAETLLSHSEEKINSFIVEHLQKLVDFSLSIPHYYGRYADHCLGHDSWRLYVDDERVIQFFGEWLTGLKSRTKSAKNI